MKKITIAIDGFSSCGKSTMAKDLAREIGYIYICLLYTSVVTPKQNPDPASISMLTIYRCLKFFGQPLFLFGNAHVAVVQYHFFQSIFIDRNNTLFQ